jgi:hypothetical protein
MGASLPVGYAAQAGRLQRIDVSFEVKYDIGKEEAIEITDVQFNDGKEIEVRDEHGWPYK